MPLFRVEKGADVKGSVRVQLYMYMKVLASSCRCLESASVQGIGKVKLYISVGK